MKRERRCNLTPELLGLRRRGIEAQKPRRAPASSAMSKVPPRERTLDLAPSGRGSCKSCGTTFAEGSVRVAKQVASAFHDGFSTEYHEPGCDHGATSIDMIPNLGSVRWSDQCGLLQVMGEKAPSKNNAEQKAACDRLWNMADQLLASAKPIDMSAFMEANGMSPIRLTKKKNKYECAYECADALLYGKPGPCPVCDGIGTLRALFPANHTKHTVMCHGFVMGGLKCEFGRKEVREFGVAGVRRERATIPDALLKKPFFKTFEVPASVLALPASAASAGVAAVGSGTKKAAAASADGPPPKKLKTKELKKELSARGLDVGGAKAEMVSRLEGALAQEGGAAAEKPVKRKKLRGNEESLKTHSGAQQEINDNAGGTDMHAKVYIGENGTCAYNVTLNQADLSTGVNKYYIIQLLEDKRGLYHLWCKWGRVGGAGGGGKWADATMYHEHVKVDKAIKEFEKKFKDKTGNKWQDRANFQQKGLYSMVLLDGDDNVEVAADEKPLKRLTKKKKVSKNAPAIAAAMANKKKTSKLDPRVSRSRRLTCVLHVCSEACEAPALCTVYCVLCTSRVR